MKVKTALTLLTTAIATMALAGVALSLTDQEPSGIDAPAAAESFRKAPGAKENNHQAPHVDGKAWRLRSYDNVRGELCLSHDVPGEAVGTGCVASEKLFADGPLFVRHGARQISAPYKKLEWDNIWVYGVTHPSVQMLTLVSMDCSARELPLDPDGVFNHVVGSDKIKKGERPYKLIAHGSNGELLAERAVSIGLPKNAVDAGIEAPRPSRECT